MSVALVQSLDPRGSTVASMRRSAGSHAVRREDDSVPRREQGDVAKTRSSHRPDACLRRALLGEEYYLRMLVAWRERAFRRWPSLP